MFITQQEVQQWFSKESLKLVFPKQGFEVERLAIIYLSSMGHRWRPWLLAGVYESVSGIGTIDSVKNIAIAIECFHKASLIHDDIEDDDKTVALHRSIGVPRALNVGDFLIHAGYSLILKSGFENKLELIGISNTCQALMCLGQGEELSTGENDFADLKTAPLFGVSFKMGTLCAGPDIPGILPFANALGEAYQALDDCRDGTVVKISEVMEKYKAAKYQVASFKNELLREFLLGYLDTMFVLKPRTEDALQASQ